MTLTLSPEVEAAIAEQVRIGKFESAEDVVAMGVGLIQGLSAERLTKLMALRRDIDVAFKDVEEGRVRELDVEDLIERAKQIWTQRQATS